jgi:integrase
MGIYKRDNVWWMHKQHKGRSIQESLNTGIKKEAEKRYADILSTIIDGSYFAEPKRIPTVIEVMERYIKEVSPQHNSHHRNIEVKNHLRDFFGEALLMTDIKSALSSYKAKRLTGEIVYQNRKAGQSTVRKELSFLRQVFNHASNEWEDDWGGFFKDYVNPVKKLMRGLKDNERTRYVTDEEAKKLARALPVWLLDIVLVLCETGYRRAIVVNLLKSQIDFGGNWININQQNPRDKKAKSKRMTSIVRKTLSIVLKEGNAESKYVFTDENGNPYSANWVSVAFGRACKTAGITNLHLHDLRHDFATRLINAGASLYQVQHQLAHSDPRMTQRYAHLSIENQNVVAMLEGSGTATILLQSKEKELQHMP